MTGISGLPDRGPLLSDRFKQNTSVTLWNQALNRSNQGPGTVVPAYNAAPRDEPKEELDGSNPANESPDGQITYRAQPGDSLIEIARQLGYDENLDPEVARRLGFDENRDYAEQYAELLTRFNPELGDDPDGLPETHVITILSDERVERLQDISEIVGDADSVEDLPQAKQNELQDLIDADLALVAGTMDQEDFEATLEERAAHLRAVLPQAEGLADLVDSRAEDLRLDMNVLFNGLRDSAAQALESGDWSAFQGDVEEALRSRIYPPPPAQTPDFDPDQEAAEFIAELAFYGPMDPDTLEVDPGYLDALEAARHQVMVTDPASQVTDGNSLEVTLTGVPADRADQILVELSEMPATGDYEDEESPPTSRLAEIVYPLRHLSSNGGLSDEAEELIGNLNVVATQAGASAPVDDDGRMQISEGVSRLAALMADANTGGFDRESPTAWGGDIVLRTAIADSISHGDGATLAVAMAAHYAEDGWADAADAMLHTVASGVENLTPEAREATEEYGRLIGDPQWAGSYLEGLRDDEELAGAIQTVQNGKLEDNPEQVANFERLFAGAMSTDAVLEALPDSLRHLEGEDLDGYERLTEAHGELRHLLVGDKDDGDDAPPPMVQVAMGGMSASPEPLTLAEVERQLQDSPEFQQYATLYRDISDTEFDAVFGDALDTYDRIQRQLDDPDADIIELPPGMTSLPPTVQEVLDGLKGKDRTEALDALRDKPVQGAALLMTLEMLENSQPNGPSGGFVSREIKNSSLLVSTVLAPSSPIAQAVANRANGGATGEAEPRDGLLGRRAAAIPAAGISGALNIWGVREFATSDRPDDRAWAAVFGLLAGMDVSRGAAAGIQSFLIPQGRHVRPATGLPSLFNQGGRLDRMTRFGYVNGPGIYRTLGTASSVLTVGVAAWTASVEFSNGNVLGGAVWTSMGLASVATVAFASTSWAGPVGWIAAGVWLAGASILHWQSNERQREYFEGDTRAILANLDPPVDPERAEILAEGRDDFGTSDEATGRPLFPLLEQLAEYRGYDTPAEKQEFFDYILYNEEALPNDMLRELSERTYGMMVNIDDDSYLVDTEVRAYDWNPTTIAQLSDWIDGVHRDDVGATNPGIRLPPRRN
ncbi:hypothetical protein ACFW16_06050 [Inquilinus sp. NPDC058860]|uniref:hypothetical protein n=1 Tax=Inquilinus sp. NPDC058860 TaxID=3346652 RepID=UPI00369E2578